GHTRPLCVLGARLTAEASDIVITILTTPNWLARARLEIAAQFSSGHEALERIRIVSVFQSDAIQVREVVPLLTRFYPAVYQTVFRGDPITCVTGATFGALPSPTAIIMDFFASAQLHQTRAISGAAVPVFAFASCGAAALVRLFAPESLGGLGDFGARTDAEALRTGKSSAEIGDQIFKYTDGSVIHVAGIPPMYDYEFFPQDVQLATSQLPSPFILLAPMFMQSDGIFVGTCTAYENEALTALNRWVTLTLHKPLYAVGPLLPPAYGSAGASSSEAPHGLEIKTFLDAALAQHGQNSTLLVSFGTLFWPTVPQYLDELVDALTEKKFPFILCHASPFATISPALRDKINASGVGMITRWSPQQYILTHPATGWFMTHCGHGGVSEALSNGVPLICWPFEGDQPAAAANLAQTLDAAFHLLEVRTGQGLRPLFGGQVPQGTRAAVGAEFRRIADACRGAEGERKRANARKVALGFSQAWKEGGTARAAVRAFLER
ncbi:hypothetical protein B0H17DRAFT_924175, partial [Mycena rosella]